MEANEFEFNIQGNKN